MTTTLLIDKYPVGTVLLCICSYYAFTVGEKYIISKTDVGSDVGYQGSSRRGVYIMNDRSNLLFVDNRTFMVDHFQVL